MFLSYFIKKTKEFCFLVFILCEICLGKISIEKDFLLYSKENRIGIYYNILLSERFDLTIGYEETLKEETVITSLSFSSDGIHKIFLLHEKNSLGFAIEKIINENNSIYLEINNMKDEDLNFFYYGHLFENVSLKVGVEKINKKRMDPLIGIYIEF